MMRVFVAYPFSNLPLPDYRDAFNAVEVSMRKRSEIDVNFEFAQGQHASGAPHVLSEIEDLIVRSDAFVGENHR